MPFERPENEKFPFESAVVVVLAVPFNATLAPLPPEMLPEMVQVPAIVKVAVAERAGNPLLVPVMVSVEEPYGVAGVVDTPSVELPAPVMLPGVKVPEAPDGRPVTPRATFPEKPPTVLTFTV